MKDPKSIQEEVEATLCVADQFARVSPSSALKGKILQRIDGLDEPNVIPFYRRTGFAAAAAVVILVLNAVTVFHYLRPTPANDGQTVQSDPIAEIRSAYSLDETTF